MNKLKKVVVFTAGVALMAQAVHAANTDLVLGFTGNGASSDALVDLGSAAQVGIGGSSVVDLIDSRGASFSATGLSGANFQSLLNSVFTTGVNGASMSVAGGQGGSTTFYYVTQAHGAVAPFAWTKNQESTVAGQASGVINGNSMTGAGSSAASPLSVGGSVNTASFSYQILGINNPGSTIASFGIDPRTGVSGNRAVADVWYDKNGQAGQTTTSTGWLDMGFLTFDQTGSTTMLLTFTPTAVPEPATYGVIGGLGFLVMALRAQLTRKNA